MNLMVAGVCHKHSASYLQEQLVRDLNQMLQNVDSKREVVVDARGAARFRGTAPEPRKGIRGGHIPGSLNVPFDSLLANGKCAPASSTKGKSSSRYMIWSRFPWKETYQCRAPPTQSCHTCWAVISLDLVSLFYLEAVFRYNLRIEDLDYCRVDAE